MNVPGFDIISKIAEGRTGSVWKAKQVSLNRLVAIKLLHPDLSSNPEEIKAFINEARSAAQLKHPNIISVFDVAEHNGHHYFVMEYVEGDTVEDILEENGKIPPQQALKIALAVADALADAWKTKKIIHRDIKPGNIIIDKDGNVKLADLGLARQINASSISNQKNSGIVEGTPNYMSPEQANCSVNIDFRTDMYSLGALLYHMITGVAPFEDFPPLEALEKHITDQIPSPRDIVPSTPIGVVQLIAKFMMKDPAARYNSWDDAASDINKTRKGRLLLVKQSPSEKASTIKQPVSMDTGKYKRAQYNKPQSNDNSISPLVSIPLWILLLVWFGVLGAYRFQSAMPVNTVPPTLQTPAKVNTVSTAPRKTSKPQESQPPKQKPSKKELSSTTEQLQQETTATKPANEPEIPPVAQSDDEALITDFKISIVNHLVNGDFRMAKALIARELEYSHPEKFETEIGKLEDFVAELSQMDEIILAGFRSKTGRTIEIDHRGKSIEILIKNVSDDKIEAEASSMVGGSEVKRGVSFTIAQLDPIELLKWINPANTPARQAMKYVLYRKAGDIASARRIASSCGPMADLFLEKAQ